MTTRIAMCWSGGKDSAFALNRLRHDPGYDVHALLTTVTRPYARVSMHGVRETLLAAQAAALGLPLIQVPIPTRCSNAEYESRMAQACTGLKAAGVTHLGFGDLYLEDIRAYRERQCTETDLVPVFPIWGEPTPELAGRMVSEGYEATVCTLDPTRIDRNLAGRRYDAAFLAELPEDVDPCGENGEFHTFVHGGPGFRRPVPVKVGETVEREGYVFADLLPETAQRGAA